MQPPLPPVAVAILRSRMEAFEISLEAFEIFEEALSVRTDKLHSAIINHVL